MKRLLLLLLLCVPLQAANEIRSFTNCTAAFAVVRETDGDVWYVAGQVFEVWGTGGRTAADYDIALTAETGGMFTGTFDTNISAGYYYVVTHDDADSSPTDTDPAVWQDYGYWTGSAWTSGADASDIDAIKAKTDNLPSDPADQSLIEGAIATAHGTTDAAIAALNDPSTTEIADAVHDEVVEGTITMRQALRLFLSVLTGKCSGGGTTTITFRDIGDTKNRLSVTVDSSGNRTAVATRDGS